MPIGTLQERAQHAGHKIRRRPYVYAWRKRGGRPQPVRGWRLSCSCGWELKVQGDQGDANTRANDHCRQVLAA